MTSDSELARHFESFNTAHRLQDSAHQTVISYLLIEPPRPATEAARRCRGWAKDTCQTVQAVSDYESAISDMMSRDLVWKIDNVKQSLIADYLAADPSLGPTNGLPEIGTLQISIRFAKLLDEFWAITGRERPGILWSRDWQTDKMHTIYSPTRQHSFDFLRDELADNGDAQKIESVAGPKPCGPWRCHWWHKYNSGFSLEVRYL